MKSSHLVSWVVCVLWFSSTAISQQNDETLVVIKETQVKEGAKVVRTLPRGTEVRVMETNGDKLKVFSGGECWIPKANVATQTKALEAFTSQIKSNSKDPGAYTARGAMLSRKKDFDGAIINYTQAIRLNPKQPEVYLLRGNTWSFKKEYNKAIADYTEVLRLNPTAEAAYTMRGNSWDKQREYRKAESDWKEAIRLNPNSDYAYNQLAWMKATCPDAAVRDGKQAVEYATKLCKLSDWKNQNDLDTLAAAYAEMGDFENAVKWQSEVCRLAPEEEKADCQSRLELYKSGKPFHEMPTK